MTFYIGGKKQKCLFCGLHFCVLLQKNKCLCALRQGRSEDWKHETTEPQGGFGGWKDRLVGKF